MPTSTSARLPTATPAANAATGCIAGRHARTVITAACTLRKADGLLEELPRTPDAPEHLDNVGGLSAGSAAAGWQLIEVRQLPTYGS